MRRAASVIAAAAVSVLGACSGTEPEATAPEASPSSSPTSPTPTPSERHHRFLTLSSGEYVAYWCAGEGGPGVLLEAGTDSGGTEDYPAAFVDPIVERTTVCTYDRLGTGASERPPRGRRNLRDLCRVQGEVLAKLPLPAPYVLVGQSGGGNLNIGCAARHPQRVAGLVTIDSYHDDPEVLRAAGFVWTDNPELVDYVHYSEELDSLTTPIGRFPVLVISATQADPGGPENQRHWLRLSPHSRQVVIEGPHDLQVAAPEEVVAEILEELDRT